MSSVSDAAEGVLTSAKGIEQNNACDEMEIPCVQEGSDKVVFMKEITEDVTLQHCKRLATRKEHGYR